MRIAVIAHHVAPIAPPFIGGVESHTWYLARWLAKRGHEVTAFALPGTVIPGVEVVELDLHVPSDRSRRDVSAMPAPFLATHHAYLDLMLRLSRSHAFDAIQINTLHHLPVAMADLLPARPLLTLHCPPTPWLESALSIGRRAPDGLPLEVIAVSQELADAWKPAVGRVPVVRNGIDLDRWGPGPGGGGAVWVGRIVPEKAPHLAIDACRTAGIPLALAGPVIDHDYFDREIAPRLGPDAHHLGHLGHAGLQQLVGDASVCVQSPAWDEPFGLVAAEAMACGTPVATFARGGLPGVVGAAGGALAHGTTAEALASAIHAALDRPRSAVRAHAEATLGIDTMGRSYEELLDRQVAGEPRRRRAFPASRSLTRLGAPAPLSAMATTAVAADAE